MNTRNRTKKRHSKKTLTGKRSNWKVPDPTKYQLWYYKHCTIKHGERKADCSYKEQIEEE